MGTNQKSFKNKSNFAAADFEFDGISEAEC
jgi:hypothetical protein